MEFNLFSCQFAWLTLCKVCIPCRNFALHCTISRIMFKALMQINVCHLEIQWVFLDCENSDCSFRYGASGTLVALLEVMLPLSQGATVLEKKRERKQEAYFEGRIVSICGKNDQTDIFLEYMVVVKCTASSTNWLTGYVSVDVLIKINCINFIEKNAVLRKHL